MVAVKFDTSRGFGLYLITDRKLAEKGGGLLRVVSEALEGGVRFIQLREKDLPARELLELARELRALTEPYGARLIINDRVDIALLSGADGVHLGQKGLSPRDVRPVLGEGMLIGVSAHSLGEAKEAQDSGADFITLGPVYYTPSKAEYGEPVGTGLLREVSKTVKTPVYAIGGIKKVNTGEVLSAGAKGVAVISAVIGSRDAKKSASELVKELELQGS